MSVQAMPRAAHHWRAVRAAATAAGLPWWTTRPSRLRGITSHRRPPRPAAQIATDRPDRWVVERIWAWLQGFGRLRTRWARRADSREAFLEPGCCRNAVLSPGAVRRIYRVSPARARAVRTAADNASMS
ncbi:transposase [Streptomyces sp. 061-3]|uniref:transposase n=1 Tax=Streptomyces sp. 061-3 TaxID=2789268 RepID=UPI00397F2CFB